MFLIRYLENLIENLLDFVFVELYKSEEYSEHNFFFELKDIFNMLWEGEYEEFAFSFYKFISDAKGWMYIRIEYSLLLLLLLMISDIFFIFYIFLVSHLLLTFKIFNDYVHNESRRNFLVLLNFFFLCLCITFIITII